VSAAHASPFGRLVAVVEAAPVVAPPSNVAASAPLESAPAAPASVASFVAEPAQESAPVARSEAPVAVESAPAPVEAAPAAEPVAMTSISATLPTAVSAAPQQEQLSTMLDAAGLIWVSTDADKLRVAQEAASSVAPAPRAPRERKALPALDTTPMQQIETASH